MTKTIQHKPKIAVFGSDKQHATKEEQALAEEVGRLLAPHAIVFTGGEHGVMYAAAKGAFEAGGITIDILPGEDPSVSNPYVSLSIATGIGYARSNIVTCTVDGAIAIGGGIGTMSEMGYMYYLQKPTVALVGSKGYADEFAGKVLDKRNLPPILAANTPEEAVNMLLEHINRASQ